MDAREARRYIMSNPPVDPVLSERRPSLLGRLFRRNSSVDEGTCLSSSPPASNISQEMRTTPRRDSITEIVQAQFSNQQPIKKPDNHSNSQEFGIFT